MSKKSKGLGDSVEKVAKLLNIPKCKRCEERRKALNKLIPFVRKMTKEEFNEWEKFKDKDRIDYTIEEAMYIKETVFYTIGVSLKVDKYYQKNSLDFWISKVDESITG